MLLALAATGLATAAEQPAWTVLAYLEARGGLTEAAGHYERALAKMAQQQGYNLAVLTLPDEAERQSAERFVAGMKGAVEREEVALPKGSVKGVLGAFASGAVRALPARRYALLVMGHGGGLLASEMAAGLSPRALRAELEDVTAELGRPVEVLGLDTCFGGSVEVAYELRGSCRYLTAAPGLIYSPGLAWAAALEGSPEAVEVARRVVMAGMAGEQRAALVGLDMQRLPEVVAALEGMSEAVRGRAGEVGATVTYVRSRTRSFGDKDELCDLKGLAEGLEENAGEAEVRLASGRVRTAVERFVVASWAGDGAGEVGPGIYYPPTVEDVPAGYAREFELARTTGWARYLHEAWRLVSGMLIGGIQ